MATLCEATAVSDMHSLSQFADWRHNIEAVQDLVCQGGKHAYIVIQAPVANSRVLDLIVYCVMMA